MNSESTGAPDLSAVARLYTESLHRHGTKPAGVGWADPASHALRFEKLSGVFEPSNENVAVNDLGSGYGALFEYLLAKGMSVSRYRGYEISEAMVAEARRRIRDPRAEFVLTPRIDTRLDYSFASGIFNVRLDQDEASWQRYVLDTLANLDRHSERGWAFNLLTTYVDYRESHLFYGDPTFFFDYCKRHFSKKVALLHDYPLYEWTILVRR